MNFSFLTEGDILIVMSPFFMIEMNPFTTLDGLH